MYHAILDVLKLKYPEPEPQRKNKEAAKSIILAFETLENIENDVMSIDAANQTGEPTETILSSIFKRIG